MFLLRVRGEKMENEVELEVSGDGHQEESQEQLTTALKHLENLTRGDGSVVTMSKAELGLLQTILRSTTEKYKEQAMWRMVKFADYEEALDHVAAYYEAAELGMDTDFNVSFMFSLCSISQKGEWNNLLSQVLDALQHGKWAQPAKGKHNGYQNPRSPLSSSN